ncbi:beach-domain-containing protein [Myriangium duriaei CBS 260.36]|uniref:Beach-domain-containing protein n=1 Tax=Myriangium duriaei CBS 260.36 TaxID=1168546 RepID=A0A9P4J3D0_9PEZI|nr:beach-domain-containing protein [Myriangium duriaei CBS 260.36]
MPVLLQANFGNLTTAERVLQLATSNNRVRYLLELAALHTKESPCIQFDLSRLGHSSLEIPCLPRAFPPPTGYTLTAWIRIDQFDVNYHTTIFGAFDATQTCFVLAYVEKGSGQLILQTSVTSTNPSVRFKRFRFERGSWYHIAIVHKPPKTSPFGEALLYVNGRYVERRESCLYPQSAPAHGSAISSAPFPPESNARRPVQAFFGTPQDLAVMNDEEPARSKWSLATAHLYDLCLTRDLVAVQHSLGPAYSGNFQDRVGQLLTYDASAALNRYNEDLYGEKAENSGIVTTIQHRGMDAVHEGSNLLSVFSTANVNIDSTYAQAISLNGSLPDLAAKQLHHITRTGNTIVFNASRPLLADALARPSGIGVLTGRAFVSIPRTIDDVAWRLSGFLGTHLMLMETASSAETLLSSFKTLCQSIKYNFRASEAMEREQGYSIVALLIREKLGLASGQPTGSKTINSIVFPTFEERNKLMLELLDTILQFVGVDSSNPKASILTNPMAYRSFLTDLDTWRSGSMASQKLYYQQFSWLLKDNDNIDFNAKRLSKMRIVRKFVDCLRSDFVHTTNTDVVLEALEVLYIHAAGKTDHRDLATFIGYCLQEGKASLPSSQSGRRLTIRMDLPNGRTSSPPVGSPRASRPVDDTMSKGALPEAQLGARILLAYSDLLCDTAGTPLLRRFQRNVPVSWLLHLLADTDSSNVAAAFRIICRSTVLIGPEFLTRLSAKNAGLLIVKERIQSHWRQPALWWACLATLFGVDIAKIDCSSSLTVEQLQSIFPPPRVVICYADTLQWLVGLVEASVKHSTESVKETLEVSPPAQHDLGAVTVGFLLNLHQQNQGFVELVSSSHCLRDLLRILYPLIADATIVDSLQELNSLESSPTAKPKDVVLRPHASSFSGGRRTIIRSGSSVTLPERSTTRKLRTPQRPSSFVLVDADNSAEVQLSAHFNTFMASAKENTVTNPVISSAADLLLDMVVGMLIDHVCLRKDFSGFGLFLKVPPGDQVHQAYFESYVLLRTMSTLWTHLIKHDALLRSPRTLTNLARYSLHMAEAVFEGWFIDGAQPLVDFTGKVLDYVQQPEIAAIKDVRLCSQAVSTVRTVFLRIVLLRLSELDESKSDVDSLKFLNQLTYWQTILFAPENQETPFIRLICYVLYTKLVSNSPPVRLAAAGLFRMLLVQKPTEAATILVHNADSNQKHLSTGFMKLATHDDEELLQWIDERRVALDKFFLDSLSKFWEDFVDAENQKTEESAKNRIAKRREKLRKWQVEESSHYEFLQQAQQATGHWRVNSHAQDRMKLHRTLQDQQENINHLYSAMGRQHELMRQPCGLQPDQTQPKWQLDQTESRDRMRMRIIRDRQRDTQMYQPKRKLSERVLATRDRGMVRSASGNSFSSTQSKPESDALGKIRARSTSGEVDPSTGESNNHSSTSLLEGDFELVDDPREDQEAFEDKNRKIMRSVERGDSIKSVYNVSRIVGLEACEGLLIIGRKFLYMRDHMFQRSDGEIVGINNAPPEERDAYVQMISGREIRTSRAIRSNASEDMAKSWAWKDVISMSKRRFLFRDVAIEVFFNDGRSYLLIFASPELRNSVYSDIANQAPHIIGAASSTADEDQWRLDCLRSPEDVPQTFGNKFVSVFNSAATNAATRKWMRGEISNFNYLMLVNTMAGRTFNDLTQYPVFPWVLADYSSEELDLENPRTFRNLSKPMGCQNSSREADFRERYQTFAEMGDEKPFHYGTHYSSAMIVTSYLIRLQPFVQSYLLLQGGSFDHADRLFDSVERAWVSASKQNMTDVRELTPEFYYLPEFLTNINEYDFGIKEGSGQAIGDVHLPKWAKGDPYLFIAKHREALESPYVSEHLHEWIDLIFGYKQKGEAAVDATNMFHPLSYHGAKDLDSIDDPVERLATIGIIHNFGQTPHQVFTRAHPRREHEKHAIQRLDNQAETLTKLPKSAVEIPEKVGSIMHLPLSNRLLAAGACKVFAPPTARFFAQWQYADNSLRFFDSDSRRLLGLFEELHVGPISTVHFIDSKTLLTAGADCTIGVWELGSSSSDQFDLRPKTYLFGHRDTVTHLAVARAFSTVLSASTNGHVIMWDLNRFDCIRILQPPDPTTPISALSISNLTGHILLCSGSRARLYTLNGHMLLDQRVGDDEGEAVTSAAFYEGHGAEWVKQLLLFTGHRRAVLKVWTLVNLADGSWHLHLVKQLSQADPGREGVAEYRPPAVTAVLPTGKGVFAGDESGAVWEWDCVVRQGRR